MIPYDDLVVALAAWRGRQGLSVAQPAGAPPAPPQPTARTTSPQPTARTTSPQPTARTTSPQPAARTAPPSAPPRPTAPRPQTPSELGDFDESEGALVYDASGDDLFSNVVEQSGEATAIGGAPEPPDEILLVPKPGKRNPDW